MDTLETIRRLYYGTTRQTIHKDIATAVALMKTMTEAERERAAVYMDGLAQMRAEWGGRRPGRRTKDEG